MEKQFGNRDREPVKCVLLSGAVIPLLGSCPLRNSLRYGQSLTFAWGSEEAVRASPGSCKWVEGQKRERPAPTQGTDSGHHRDVHR